MKRHTTPGKQRSQLTTEFIMFKRLSWSCEQFFRSLPINWSISQPGVDSVIAGANNADQVSDNIASAEMNIGEDQLREISALNV